MRTEYPVWEYVGYSWSAIRETLKELDENEIEEARDRLKKTLDEYYLMMKCNGV